MCQVSKWANHQRAADMLFDDFKSLLDSQYGLVEIKIQGMGEPTLGGDSFYQMIKYAREQHIWVRVITNASLLHINNNYQKLIDSGANEIQISIDGATKGTFEGIRRGSRFERVCENCKLINEYVKAEHITPTKMWTVVQKLNICELPELVELAYKLGFRHLVFSLELQDWGQDDWLNINDTLSARRYLTPEMASNLIHKGNTLGVKVAFWTVTTKYKAGEVDQLCPWPFERAYVSSDMYIVPCCMIGNPDVSNLGNANYFADAWNGDAYRKFRKAPLKGNIPRFCLGCYEV
jgi:pyrroloquinoline quinone biosynthesis protein E